MAKPMFEHNIEFLKFLNLVRTKKTLRDKLNKRDFSVIENYPKLSPEERDALKVIDWRRITFHCTWEDIKNFGSRTKTSEAAYLIKKLGPNRVQSSIV